MNPAQFVDSLQAAVNISLQNNLVSLIAAIPNLIAAFVLVLIGWLAGVAVSKILEKTFEVIKFESFLSKNNVSNALGKIKISNAFVKLTEYYVVLIFLQAAVSLVGLGTITDFLNSLLNYAPVTIGAAMLFIIAAIAGELVKDKVIALEPKSKLANYIAKAMKLAIIFMGLMVGLSTVGFDMSIFTLTFLTLIQGLIYGFALAIGIAFGLGGQESAKEILSKAKERVKI